MIRCTEDDRSKPDRSKPDRTSPDYTIPDTNFFLHKIERNFQKLFISTFLNNKFTYKNDNKCNSKRSNS